ncbi:hypothetical protein Fcan01_02199 [Folsomia candida]|uniref:Uncharacterized protein n=1 Tax=Folsomia candida TaxID=158441 RepID=A0A226EWE6_FOLCA|nr:hypothetical protein Fcan01_02199 [Folsomia candida]
MGQLLRHHVPPPTHIISTTHGISRLPRCDSFHAEKLTSYFAIPLDGMDLSFFGHGDKIYKSYNHKFEISLSSSWLARRRSCPVFSLSLLAGWLCVHVDFNFRLSSSPTQTLLLLSVSHTHHHHRQFHHLIPSHQENNVQSWAKHVRHSWWFTGSLHPRQVKSSSSEQHRHAATQLQQNSHELMRMDDGYQVCRRDVQTGIRTARRVKRKQEQGAKGISYKQSSVLLHHFMLFHPPNIRCVREPSKIRFVEDL